jgi:Mrp family chromosome partitioning ATPase
MSTTLLLSSIALNLAAAGLAGLAVGSAFLPRRRALRSENQLIEALGAPLLAARPLAPQALAAQLLAHWFRGGRRVLTVASAESGIGRTRAAAELARAFAAMGERVLLIDADFRSPGLHAEFGLANRGGLAEFLEDRDAALAHCSENLSVLVAGRPGGADPLDLLSRQRVQALLAAAAQRYTVVLVDTPAAARGPDLQLFAAYGGGALVVTRRATSPEGLEHLRKLLDGCKSRVVATVLSPE